MVSKLAALAACSAMAVACGGSPTGPTSGTTRAARFARITRTRFLAFGDSLTSGEVTAPAAGSGGVSKLIVVPSAAYPTVLQAQLQSAYPSQASLIVVNNQGKAAETIFDGVVRFNDVFNASQPEVVLLQEGVNGLGFGGAEGSTALMRSMVRVAKNGNARVFVGSMIPTLADRQRSQNVSLLEAYDDVLRVMCTQEGVTYVDLYNGILPQADQWIGVDGLHPNESGYRRIAELFFAAIKNELEER